MGAFSVRKYAGEFSAIMVGDDHPKLIVFAKRFAAGAPLFSGEFHCGKGIMSSHGKDQKAA